MKSACVWVVDDEPAICWSLRKGIESRGYHASVFSTAEDAILAAQSHQKCDVLVTDIRLPKKDGFAVLAYFAAARTETPVIMMTAFGDLETAVKATQHSVFEYLVKPFDLKEALHAIDKAVERQGRQKAIADFSVSITESLILGNSPLVQKLYRDIAVASQSDHPVMILGAEGAPTESVASAIHRNSDRRSNPFLSFLPTTFSLGNLEREFIGSTQRDRNGESLKTGLLGLVGNGSLYIEEVSDLPSKTQTQLLRVLELGNYLPLDATESLDFKGRVIASSTRSLVELVESREFDAGLLQRFKIQQIEIPPLNSRREDAVAIANALVARAGANTITLSSDAEEWIASTQWQGDVRQLRNCVEHASASSPGQMICRSDLQSAYNFIGERSHSIRNSANPHREKIAAVIRNWLQERMPDSTEQESAPEFGMLYDEFLALVEQPFLAQLLEQLQYNRAATAAKLGMHRSTLRQKMRKYEID